MKLLFECTYRNKSVKVYRDSQWNDHIVKYYQDNKHLKEADSHHYEDRDDALSTARYWVSI
jgi:hypothetical protein